ncbi:MAG: FtsX-like permease family protein, partial [Thermoplasmata archaeon]
RQVSAAIVAEAGVIKAPLRFRDLAISPVTKPDLISISSLAVDGTVIEPFSELIEGAGARYFPGFWWRTDAESGTFYETLPPTRDLPRDGSPTSDFRIGSGPLPTFIRPGAVRSVPGIVGPIYIASLSGPVPALAPPQMMSRFGLSVGKTIQVDVDGVGISALLVGVADHFPTLYPELGDFLVLDRDPLLIDLARAGHQSPWPNEIWVRAAPGGADKVDASLANAPGIVSVVDERTLATAAARSPQELALKSNLILGFVTALGLALLAFAFHFLMVARARLSDYAVLEANGMSAAQVRRSLILEEFILVGFCLICGAALGALVTLVVLPAIQLGASVPENVPETIVTVDPMLMGIALAALAVGALSSGLALAVAVERPKVMAELRALG